MKHIVYTSAVPTKPGQRLVFIDLLRVLCCFGVIVNHTVNQLAYTLGPSISWTGALLCFFAAKVAVPMFVMISGYLLLPRREPMHKSFFRAGRVAMVIWLFSLLYYAFGVTPLHSQGGGLGRELWRIWGGPATVAFWYLYMYLGLLLLMPVWQKLASAMTRQDYWLLLGVVFVTSSLWPWLTRYLPDAALPSYFITTLPAAPLGWLFLGGYFARWTPPQKRKYQIAALLLFVAALGCNVANAYGWYDIYVNAYYLFGEEPEFPFILIESACLFYLCMGLAPRGRAAQVVCVVGRCTFGIYLFADLLIILLAPLHVSLSTFLHPLVAVLVFDGCLFCVGLGITWLLCRIPLLKKLLGG